MVTVPSGHRLVPLRHPAQFQRVISDGARMHGRHVLLFVLKSDLDAVRLGVSASSNVRTNVARNRLRRLLREAARREWGVLGRGLDIVLIAKAGAVGGGLDDIAEDVRQLFSRVASLQPVEGGRGAGC
ncbi:MAG: ribonuclease P protein component [Bacillota bacterium]|nr:MAG: ribonuclease P protein component [Bacillota bacterium]